MIPNWKKTLIEGGIPSESPFGTDKTKPYMGRGEGGGGYRPAQMCYSTHNLKE